MEGKLIYFIQNEVSLAIKIGVATDPEKRLSMLQIGSVDRLKILGTMPGLQEKEAELHRQFAGIRIRGEWFRPEPPLMTFIQSYFDGKMAPFMKLVEHEPELLKLLEEARSITSRPKFCANEVWYGYPGSGFQGIKTRLTRLVGFYRESGRHPVLSTSQAYDVAYETIYEALPDCKEGCACQCVMAVLMGY